ncbi:bifunctional 4-alpha-glucanotransferase/amylo-alpha-1,6-glucosidase [Sugiyamaella lignohabitans]|uniref:Glycogen debranching enzyme n=1 Tax=Sugiyamaella lignohabitans TaxID=796027 RepID=A0A167E1W9_9ASCO|nr:bifunctional 4-alpha-glucanotransferase/amylo-alpha-1,6-glucosidase [Sugiyamaella lignohabitans]ANB13548.1 bifunctional 4-alpha-glucanotransferase/amylo-alpha-1,6-glucosidase [Sugiyamaella lignohabitans]
MTRTMGEKKNIVYVIPLSEAGDPVLTGDGKFLRLPIPHEPYVVRIVLFSWLKFVQKGSFWCNAPLDPSTPFDRHKYYEYPLKTTDCGFSEDIHVDIKIFAGGPYSCYITYKPPSEDYFSHVDSNAVNGQRAVTAANGVDPEIITSTKKFHFIVSTGFSLGGKPIELDSLSIQTVLSKLMGPVNTWGPKLKAIKDKGYNMIHFTPLQYRGASDSPFSIYDQLDWDPKCFPNGEDDIAQLVSDMEHKYGLLSLTDVVLNHTAHNSDWLRSHPEVGYSVETAPHLKPALDLDTQLLDFSAKLSELGLPDSVESTGDLDRIIGSLKDHVLEPIRLWEYYVVDVQKTCKDTVDFINNKDKFAKVIASPVPQDVVGDLQKLAKFVKEKAALNFDRFGEGRYLRELHIPTFVSIIKTLFPGTGTTSAVHYEAKIRQIVDEINEPLYQEYDDEVSVITSQLYNRVKYTRLDGDGPRLGKITKESPLTDPYFTRIVTHPEAPGGKRNLALVNNGWIWSGNPLIDFASNKSRAYLRREVIIWGDCVKLRYGEKHEDSPFLWDHMKKYAQLLAKYFHGFRIDNCHSTPIHVGEYFLDMARLVRPNLYTVAELFTGSEEMDKIFIERLGLTSLIREAMQAWSVQELSTLVNKNGGRPMGSFAKQPLVNHGERWSSNEEVHLVRASPIHAWFMDCTHDNESAAEKRTVEDTLPSGALVAMCACAVGSTVGFDECYPKSLNVVTEERQYTFGGGISEIKKVLNDAHFEMGQLNADETYTHHEGQYITVHRVDPSSGEGYFLIARTKFHPDSDQRLSDVVLKGTRAECVLAVALAVDDSKEAHNQDDNKVYGIPTKIVTLEKPHIDVVEEEGETTSIIRSPHDFPQGSIALIKTYQTFVDKELDNLVRSGAREAVEKLNWNDLNVALYRCESEERDSSRGKEGVYVVPDHGALEYAGIQGWASVLEEVVLSNNLGHPLCANLRNGRWALDYTVNRLRNYVDEFPNLQPLIEWYEVRFNRIRQLPPFLIPRYFALILYTIHSSCTRRALSLMPQSYQKSTLFLQELAMVSVQMVGKLPSASVFPFEQVGSMAAGLPHFSRDYMRCWGRDVFISLPGLLLALGRHEDAKNHILAFAATLKHGLIPNLLDSGRNPRYNARDATWFFLQVVQEYTQKVPDGQDILFEKVKRRFPLDDTYVPVDDSRAFSHSSSIKEIVYEILSRHAKGIKFREANAGTNLDSQMRDEGFNQNIFVDWDNGFVFGGNQWNCGTWMDKMGESERAGSKGIPGTPRDGAAIEIIGLLKSSLRWVNQLHRKGVFEWDHVINQHGDKIMLRDWEYKISSSFEHAFYVPASVEEDSSYDIDSSIVNRRGIYKDLYRSGKPYEDYQLRPNFAIAMVAAPELFNYKHAINAIGMADKIIRGPVGMATLDPSDLNYRPYYNNSEDSNDFATSKGRNYHQGPEWVWCTGFFLRAFLFFNIKKESEEKAISIAEVDKTEVFAQLRKRISGHVHWLHTSRWKGLTELTNKDGQFCYDSSPTQAWSAATLIELYEDARALAEK